MKVAIVGSGIAGISAAYNLWKHSQEGVVEVTIYEAAEKLGGHSCTVKHPNISRPIDVGFQVFNLHAYPLFCQFLQELDVEICDSDMSFCVQSRNGWSWSSRAVWTSFKNNPWKFVSLLCCLRQFYSAAEHFLNNIEKKSIKSCSVLEFIDKYNLPTSLIEDFLLPFASSVWSIPEIEVHRFDALTMLKFMHNHQLLSFNTLKWKTLAGSTEAYIQKFTDKCKPRLKLKNKVSSLTQTEASAWNINGEGFSYDHVVFACHGDEVKDIKVEALADASENTYWFVKDLRSIRYSSNIVIVHTDEQLMPSDKALWSSWNFAAGVVTYWENSLQLIGHETNVFVTLLHQEQLDNIKIQNDKIICKKEMAHPSDIAYNIATGFKLHSSESNLHACGAYMGYGFHEDAFKSGLEAALEVLQTQNMFRIGTFSKAQHKMTMDILMWPTSYFASTFLHYYLTASVKDHCIGVQLPGKAIQFYGKKAVKSAVLSFKSYSALFACMLKGDLGFTESYMKGDIGCDNLPLFFCSIMEQNDNSWSSWFLSIVTQCSNVLTSAHYRLRVQNSPTLAKQNISEHYDLGNDFFASFLDKTLTYSSAIFKHQDEPLTDAQMRKYNTLINDLDLQSTDHVLEIGTGWGFFACHMVHTCNCHVTTITLSHEQAVFAQEQIEKEDLEDKITLLEVDYRDIVTLCDSGNFSVVVSVEMIEAVGHSNFDRYFHVISTCSTPGVRIGIQAITRCEDNYDRFKNSPDFINRHIFPGGCLPSLGAISRHASRNGLSISKVRNISQSYALTLHRWRGCFLKTNKDKIDPVMYRKWDLYFSMCQAAFHVGKIQDYQIILTKTENKKLP